MQCSTLLLVTGLAWSALSASPQQMAERRGATPDDTHTLRVTPDYFDYTQLPKAEPGPVTKVQELVGTRRFVKEKDELLEHYVLDVAYARRDGEILMTRYAAIRSDGALVEFEERDTKDASPVEDLAQLSVGQEIYHCLVDLEGLDLEQAFLRADEHFESERRPQPAEKVSPVELEQWLGEQTIVKGLVTAHAASIDENGYVAETMTLELRHRGVVFHLETSGPPPTAGFRGTFSCHQFPIAFCIDVCIGNCSPFPNCRCSFLGRCFRLYATVCGPCPVGGGCRKQLVLILGFPPRFRYICLC